MVRRLTDAGYRVQLAPDGALARTMVKGTSTSDLLVVDQRMPGMSGDDFVRAVRVFRPMQAVLRVLGNLDDATTRPLEGGCASLPKPFAPEELLAAVQKCIGRP
jgi:DNA-binding response OmpR family regulator